MTKGYRIAFFAALALGLVAIFYFWLKKPFPTDDHHIVLFSALLLLAFSALLLEHFFTKPTDSIAASVSILLQLAPLGDKLQKMGFWFDILFAYNVVVVLAALTSLTLLDPQKSPEHPKNVAARRINAVTSKFGSGKALYFLLFVVTLFFYVDSQSVYFLILFSYSAFVVLIDPRALVMQITRSRAGTPGAVGQIFGVQSGNTFLVRLYDARPAVKRFDFVQFFHRTGQTKRFYRGLIIESHVLDNQQWIKVLTTAAIMDQFAIGAPTTKFDDNVAYLLDAPQGDDFLRRFVGVVVEKSDINKIRFEYGERALITEGALLQVQLGGSTILYQVIQAVTEIEILEHKNEAGLIIGEAIQLGTWDHAAARFIRYGWVPTINSPVLLAHVNYEPEPQAGNTIIGTIPGTTLPVWLKLSEAVAHHIAILGVTGSGKSVFTRNLIRQIALQEVKIICVDFTNEYQGKFADLGATSIIDAARRVPIFAAIDKLAIEQAKFANQQDRALIERLQHQIEDSTREAIRDFLQSATPLAIFELPDVSNSSNILEYTKVFFQMVFAIARENANYGHRLCVVLEEAHTVVPEWNFAGSSDRSMQAVVNRIGQIALQGRKYGVGFIVVAQRTANVSKTVLTQCNTIIAFQQFDRTSAEFLSGYLGPDIIKALPGLRMRQAIAAGKGLLSSVPVIFEVPNIVEQ